jgi:hypothetical protein
MYTIFLPCVVFGPVVGPSHFVWAFSRVAVSAFAFATKAAPAALFAEPPPPEVDVLAHDAVPRSTATATAATAMLNVFDAGFLDNLVLLVWMQPSG